MISVIMPVYKNDNIKYFKQAFESIINQTYKPSKIVIVKDGFIDKQIQDYINGKLNETTILIDFKNNKGIAKALNAGIKLCDTKYIARMDSDDISLMQRFEHQIRYFEKNPEIDILGSWISEIDEENNIIKKVVKYPISVEKCFKRFKYRDPVAHPTVIYKRKIFDIIGLYPEEKHGVFKNEDTWLWFKAYKNNIKISNIDQVLLYYRRTKDFYKRRGNINRLINLYSDRIRINRELNYGLTADLAYLLYIIINIMPFKIKRVIYNKLR